MDVDRLCASIKLDRQALVDWVRICTKCDSIREAITFDTVIEQNFRFLRIIHRWILVPYFRIKIKHRVMQIYAHKELLASLRLDEFKCEQAEKKGHLNIIKRALTWLRGSYLRFFVHYFNFRWKRIEWNLKRVHNTNISPFANIEKGHIGGEIGDIGVTAGVTIGSGVRFGRWVTIAPSNQGAAVIENNVTIWTGAVIVGKVTLGSGCTVGANSVVIWNVARGASVLGSPARALPMP
jgi:serine acetyltransferase